jgi:TldD protein
MPVDRGMTRRRALGIGAAAFGSAAAYEILAGPARALAATGPGTTAGLSYFTRFGVTEALVQATLAEALSSGGDFADVYCQHRVGKPTPTAASSRTSSR